MSAAPPLPSLLSGVNLKALPLQPREAFVLSRIDGASGPREISLGTGIPEGEVHEILVHLTSLGAIRYDGAPKPPSSAGGSSSRLKAPVGSGEQSPRASGDAEIHEAPKGDIEHARTILAPKLITKATTHSQLLFEEVNDLDRETRIEILDFERLLERVSHYELLGVAVDAEKKAIKAAYFDKVNRFHTDRFFGKSLGTFKSRLESIFRALTKAHDTLTKAKVREEYDRYLASRQATQGLLDSLPPPTPPGGVHPLPEIPAAPRALTMEDFDDPVATPGRATRAPDPEAARRLLAKKFGLRNSQEAPPNGPPSSNSEPDSESLKKAENDRESVRKMVSEQMRARFDARNNVEGQIVNYLTMAEESRRKGDYGAALNALKTALAVEPHHIEANRMFRETRDEADRELADHFAEQAKYEEADGHLLRAARSYERAARGKKSAHLYDRAANCLLRAFGDKRKCVELARNAVTIDGSSAAFRLTLAKAYDFAGMKTSAVAEVTRSLDIDPKLSEAKALLKQLK